MMLICFLLLTLALKSRYRCAVTAAKSRKSRLLTRILSLPSTATSQRGWDSILGGFQLVVGFANWIEIKYDPAFVVAFESL